MLIYTVKSFPKPIAKIAAFQPAWHLPVWWCPQKHPLKNCPHIPEDVLEEAQAELEVQYKQGKWLQKDMAAEALQFAKEKANTLSFKDIADRIGGRLTTN